MRKSRGFTIIELMIVVTIVGILAAIAIPGYTNYVTRAKITEGITLAHPVEIAVNDFYTTNGALPDDNPALNFGAPATLKGKYVSSINVTLGVIVVTFGDAALVGRTLTFTPTVSGPAVNWDCTTTLPPVLKPKGCS